MTVCILDCLARMTDGEIDLALLVVIIWIAVVAAIWAGRQHR